MESLQRSVVDKVLGTMKLASCISTAGMARVLVVVLLAVAGLMAQDPDVDRERWEPVAKVLAALGLDAGQRVADVGAGDGFHTERIARVVGPTGRVTAVDINENALKKLKERVAAARLTNVEVVLGQVADPRLDAASYDAVLIYNSYHEMPEYLAMLQHIRDSLKLGGRVVIVEPIHDKNRGLSREGQVAAHEIAPNLVEAELRAAHFEVREKNESFTRFTDASNPGGFWLIVAARAEGLKRLHLSATLNAVLFYESTGYIREESTVHRLPTGIELSCLRMPKDLTPTRGRATSGFS